MGKLAEMNEEQQVKEANDNFYFAVTSADLEQMDQIWVNSPESVCVHPGREALFGYDEIRESWLAIFENTESMSISASGQRITIVKDVAWVICNETISLMTADGLAAAAAQATNIYRRIADQWKLILHHASPVPFTSQDDWPDVVN